jgi:hypothetical protein
MDPAERQWLGDHLRQQAAGLVEVVNAVTTGTPEPECLAQVRDALFTMQETLDTLGVPHALASHSAWQEAIGTEQE